MTIRQLARVLFGLAAVGLMFGVASVFAFPDVSGHAIHSKSGEDKSFLLAQHGGPPDCRGSGHGGGSRHCSEMGHEGGCSGGKEGCRGGRGMGRGMHHGGGKGGPAQCPQPRATVKAPEDFYKRTNPIESTPDTIEKGRLLFQLDTQPTCVMCHGSQGDGTGGFGTNLSPSPRNFTCEETMRDIPDGQLFWIIRNGSPDTGMPPFQDLRDEQIWNLILFIRSIAK
jgi:mono/diheme cytochrome c family protein